MLRLNNLQKSIDIKNKIVPKFVIKIKKSMNATKLLLSILLVMPFSVFAQNKVADTTFDYEYKIYKLYQDGIKQTEETAEFKEAKSKLIAYNKRKNNYNGVGFVVNYNSVNVNSLNASIAANGFSQFNNYNIGIGFLGNYKHDNILVDVNFINFSFFKSANKSSTNQKISMSSVDFLQTNVGYAIVNNPNFTLYPYLGIGLRASTMDLENTQVVNAGGTNITNYISSPKFVRSRSLKVTYQIGLGMDLKLNPSSKRNMGSFLFIKGGLNNTIGDEKFRIDDDFKFNPNMQIGVFQINLGIKFVRYNTATRPELTR